MRVLKMYPKEFTEAYVAYKKNKLTNRESLIGSWDTNTNQGSTWWLLDPECAFKINLNNSDMPLLINTCTKILDLDEAQDLDRRKMMQ